MMKKNLLMFCFFIFGALLFYSCSEKADTALDVTATSYAFDAQGGEKAVRIATDKSSWRFETPGGSFWFKATKSDDMLYITVPKNPTDNIRTGVILVMAGNITIKIDISQEPDSFYIPGVQISPSVDDLKVRYGKGSVVFTISTTGEWDASVSKQWITVDNDYAKNTTTLSWEKNVTDAQNNAILTITVKGYSKEISIEQYMKEQDPYYSLIGKWDMYCSQWLFFKTGETLGEGTYAYLYLDENVPYESFALRDFLVEGLETVLFYDPQPERLLWPLYWYDCFENASHLFLYAQSKGTITPVSISYSPMPIDGYVSEDHTRIDFNGVPEYGIGLFAINKSSGGITYFTDLYYANADDFHLVFSEDQSTASIRPTRVIEPAKHNFRYNGDNITMSPIPMVGR